MDAALPTMPLISGRTALVAHLGYPTESFKAPMIYNPWFAARGIDAVVVPMGVRADDYPAFLPLVFRLSNIRGALVTMPHKVRTMGLVDHVTPTAAIAGATNAIRAEPDGRLTADQFDGEGFVRGVLRKGQPIAGRRALVVGCGGVGSAIAASLARAGVAELALQDPNTAGMEGLAARLSQHYPALRLNLGHGDPAGFDIVVNATPLGMRPGDPLPMDVDRIDLGAFVGEVVLSSEMTPFLRAAAARGCRWQVGTDMLFEMIPAYLEFFGLGTATADELRATARIAY
ncbi:shikimate dehydrogenase [Paracoccus sp. (in: a-proteobacteria)]|uniref:shikimate dehydrogenase family protein n=1 Tax=Paracoccus sp. TaxID=267 RepID=UPI0026E01D10|nr:ThiF family adenylyltransferase [Paracoccus sp. (in: a-proteobacteria)]MDO5370472.1 ThiF family adenylyltransferase [Paracoccus sp. (in: a-proteobacteria)]